MLKAPLPPPRPQDAVLSGCALLALDAAAFIASVTLVFGALSSAPPALLGLSAGLAVLAAVSAVLWRRCLP